MENKHIQGNIFLQDETLRTIYRRIGRQGYGDDVNPFSLHSRFPYEILKKTGKNIPRMLFLMRNDPEITRLHNQQQALRMNIFKRYSSEMQEAINTREKYENEINAHRVRMARRIVLPPFPNIAPYNKKS